jgi:hypothetical protein
MDGLHAQWNTDSMPNGTLDIKFRFYFSGKALDLWSLKPHREAFIPNRSQMLSPQINWSKLFD